MHGIRLATGLFSLVALFLLNSVAAAQPMIELGVGGTAFVPTADFGGTVNDFLAGTKYGSAPGVGFHLATRFSLAGIPWRASFNYAILKNSGAAATGSLELTQKIFSTSLQPEYVFSDDRSATRLYVGAILELNNFGGDATFAGISGIPDGIALISSSERLGVGAATGILLPLNDRITLDIACSYRVMNPVGQRWENDPTLPPRLNAYQWLNDAADPLYAAGDPNHVIKEARAIHSFQFSVSFFFAFSKL